MSRIERVERMEQDFETAVEAVSRLALALEDYTLAQGAIFSLEDYVDSGKWLKDYDADGAGLFPRDFKRGVLSQDALYDLLSENRRLLRIMGGLFEQAEER